LQFTYVQATREAFSPQKRTSSTYIKKIHFFNFFLSLWVIFSLVDPGSKAQLAGVGEPLTSYYYGCTGLCLEKLHYMAPNIYCAGAGTAADCDKTTSTMSSQLELHR
jgi:hypothetical protein